MRLQKERKEMRLRKEVFVCGDFHDPKRRSDMLFLVSKTSPKSLVPDSLIGICARK